MPSLSCEQIAELARGFTLGLTREQISSIAFANIPPKTMHCIIEDFYSKNQVDNLRKIIEANYS